MMIESFTTERLTAHRITEADYDDYRRMRDDPQVSEWLGGSINENEKRRKHREALTHWKRYGFGLLMLRMTDTNEFVGRVGLRHGSELGKDVVELLYAVMPKFWKQGLCTEAAREALRVGFDELLLTEIVAYTMTTNLGSRRVMEKCGMLLEREFVHYDLSHVLYRKKLET